MKKEIKVLILEDAEEDFRLIERSLKKAAFLFQTKLVDTKDEYVEALHTYHADVILSDHSLPQFNSAEALSLCRKNGLKIPFIIVTGNVSEEFAVTSIKKGVDDYILKSNLERLPTAIHNALKQKENENVYNNTLRELRSNHKTLLKYNQELESFIKSVSHNLRTPLYTLLNLLNLIRNGEQSSDHFFQQYFDMMENSILKLDEALRQLQDHSHRSKIKLSVECVNIANLLEEEFERMKFMPGAESLAKEINISEKTPLYSNVYYLSMIVNNLISNSIKYRDAEKRNSYLKISIVVDPTRARLEFQDNGIGIDSQHVPKVFDMFFRATGEKYGAGLGLHIVKESVEKLKGTITVNSSLGSGTIFSIDLPNYMPVGHSLGP